MYADPDRVKQAKEFLKTRRKISELISSFGRLEDKTERGREIRIKCPFHSDESPSFDINDDKGICHCLSCGAGGDYVQIHAQLFEQKHHSKLNYFASLEMILKSDVEMHSLLPFKTIYSEVLVQVTTEYSSPRLRPKEPIMNVMMLAEKMKKAGRTSFSDISLAQSFLLAKNSPSETWDLFSKAKTEDIETPVAVLTAADLLKEVDW